MIYFTEYILAIAQTLITLSLLPIGIIAREEQSLFTYKQNFGWETYYDPNFEPIFEPTFSDTALEQQAMESCGDDVFCLFDVATTGRMDIGLSTLNGSRDFEELVNLSYPGNEILINVQYSSIITSFIHMWTCVVTQHRNNKSHYVFAWIMFSPSMEHTCLV